MKTFYRSVWISDVHLSTKDTQADMLYSFLDSLKCDYLYLVGDIIDIWALRKKWHWPGQYNEVLHKLLKRSRKGAKIYYIPGNHDEFFRGFAGYSFGEIDIVSHVMHTTVDGRRFLVLHGDEFDTLVRYRPWMSHLGCRAYRHLITVNRVVNEVRAMFGWPYWSLSGAIRRRVQQAVRHLHNFEDLLIDEARRRKVDGVICGHTHQPGMREIEGIRYCNMGDWVESCTALVETEAGEIKLIYWKDELEARRRAEVLAAAEATPKVSLAAARSGKNGTGKNGMGAKPLLVPVNKRTLGRNGTGRKRRTLRNRIALRRQVIRRRRARAALATGLVASAVRDAGREVSRASD